MEAAVKQYERKYFSVLSVNFAIHFCFKPNNENDKIYLKKNPEEDLVFSQIFQG